MFEVAVIALDPNIKEIKEEETSNLSNVSQLVNGGTGIWIQISVTPEPTSILLNELDILVWG